MRRIAVCALVLAALAATGAAGAQEDGAEGGFPTCPDSPAASAFTDIGQLSEERQRAIACILHYGVTRGVSAAVFAPDGRVTRAQMARFLIRTARALGLDLSENPTSRFTDIAHLDEETRLDIARLLQLGVTRGASDGIFDPGREVPRGQMARFIHRLLLQAGIGLPEVLETFEDLPDSEAELTRAAGQLAAAEIMPGAAPALFRPDAAVTRSDMALHLARSLETGEAQPVRLSIVIEPDRLSTAGSTTAEITALKPNGDPYPGLLIDVFAVGRLYSNGLCWLDAGARINGVDAGTSADCRIDRADPRTDSMGKVVVGLSHSPTAAVNIVYAWAGAEGQVFDADLVGNETSAPVVWRSAPTELQVTSPAGAKYEAEVTITALLRDSTLSRQRIVIQVIRDDLAVHTREATVSGSQTASFQYTGPVKPKHHTRVVTDTIRVFWDRNGNGLRDGPAELLQERPLVWS